MGLGKVCENQCWLFGSVLAAAFTSGKKKEFSRGNKQDDKRLLAFVQCVCTNVKRFFFSNKIKLKLDLKECVPCFFVFTF